MTKHFPIHGAGGGGCFTGDTIVCTPKGGKRIDEIVVGEYVYSFDDNGKLHEGEVLAVHIHEGERVNEYTIWGNNTLKATPNHWVLNQYNAFVPIGSLKADDCVIDENDHLRPIVKVVDIGYHCVYNLTVKGFHTFIAGGIRVHNAGLGHGLIKGAGGGGGDSKSSGGSRTPETDPDGLNSEAAVIIIDVLGEGKIEGFPSARDYEPGTNEHLIAALKDVYLDGTSIVRANANPASISDSDYNYRVLDFVYRRGSNTQVVIDGLNNVRNEVSVNVKVEKDYPVTREISDVDVDKVRVTLTFPALQEFQSDGDIRGQEVEYRIRVLPFGGSPITLVETTVKGRSADPYQKDHVVDISTYTKPVSIIVARRSDDSNSVKKQNEMYWTSYTEITSAKMRYPNTAYVGLAVSARDFSSIPTRSYKIRGVRIRIPNNGTVDQTNGRIVYTGIWDGEFALEPVWTSDPAWILWDMLTNCRYGLGQHINGRNLDKFSFYQASQYCSELIPDGKGGTEPRFSCNIAIRNQQEAYKLINDLASVFRAMPYWATGSLRISQDRPTDPTFLFNQSNITSDGFSYSGSSLKSRHTVAIVSFFDNIKQELNYVSVEDSDAIIKYGSIPIQVEGVGCTTRSQARRVGEWLLYSENYETEVCTFTTTIEAVAGIVPGTVIKVSDLLRSGGRRGGRIKAAGSNYIVVDDALATDLPTGGSPSLLVMLTDGTTEEKSVSSVSASTGKITVSSSFSTTPLVNGAFIYDNNDQKATLWRVISIKESDQSFYQINAVSYNPAKYDYIDREVEFEEVVFLPLEFPELSPPSSLTSNFVSTVQNGAVENKVYLSWPSDSNASYYNVSYRYVDDGAWRSVETTSPTLELTGVKAGVYEVRISSVNGIDQASVESTFSFLVDPYSLPMENVSGLTATVNSDTTVRLNWTAATRSYIVSGGSVVINYQNTLSGATWADSSQVASVAGSATGTDVPLLTGSYLVRFKSSTGTLSDSPAIVTVQAPAIEVLEVDTLAEHLTIPPFNGIKTNMYYDSAFGGIVLQGGATVDDIGIGQDWDSYGSIDGYVSLVDSLTSFDLLGVVDNLPSVDDIGAAGGWDALESVDQFFAGAIEGEYIFDEAVDMGAVFDTYVRQSIKASGFALITDFDTRIDNIDTWTDLDAISVELGEANVYVRASSNGSSYSDWQVLFNSTIRGRYFQFKAIASSSNASESILITELGSTVSLPKRSETWMVTGNGAVTFQKAFYQAPSVMISGNDAQSGDYYQVTSLSRTGMTVTWYNSSNATVSRTYTYQAVGYGTEIV